MSHGKDHDGSALPPPAGEPPSDHIAERYDIVHFLAGHTRLSWFDRLALHSFLAVVRINRRLPLNRDPRATESTVHHG